MPTSRFGVVRNGKIELTEDVALPEGSKVLVTVLANDEDHEFWIGASHPSLDSIWDNQQDNIYRALLPR
jgi:hypothetical protein